MDTELKIKLLKENQKEMERLESFNSQSLYLLKFASKLAENNFKIVIYTTRKNNSKFVKIFIKSKNNSINSYGNAVIFIICFNIFRGFNNNIFSF